MLNAESREQDTPSRKRGRPTKWPVKITVGRATVPIYRRKTPSGSMGYLVVRYQGKRRRFESYPTEAEAREVAALLARQLSEQDTLAASITKEGAIDFAGAKQTLRIHNVTLTSAAEIVSGALQFVDLASIIPAAKFYSDRHGRVIPACVADVVGKMLKVKEGEELSRSYLHDLRCRLNKFASDFQRDIGAVTTGEVQEWLDGLGLSPQSKKNYRRCLSTLWEFAIARNHAGDNVVEKVERIRVRDRDIEVYSPEEIAKLLSAATPEFLPSLAISAFAGLRSAEVERLEWSDIHLAERSIVVGASKAKTASRRVLPMADNLAQWLQPYAGRTGRVWSGTNDQFYQEQPQTAKAAGLKWNANALRHSFASYRCALIGDAGRVTAECGNTASVIHKHYRELVRPEDARRWFDIRPEAPANVLRLNTAASK